MANYCQFEITFDTETTQEDPQTLTEAFRKLCEDTVVNPKTVHPVPSSSLDEPSIMIYGECKWVVSPAVEVCEKLLGAKQIPFAEITWSELGSGGVGLINVYLDDDGTTSHSHVYRAEPPTTIAQIKRVIKECPALEPQLQWYLDDLEAEAEADA